MHLQKLISITTYHVGGPSRLEQNGTTKSHHEQLSFQSSIGTMREIRNDIPPSRLEGIYLFSPRIRTRFSSPGQSNHPHRTRDLITHLHELTFIPHSKVPREPYQGPAGELRFAIDDRGGPRGTFAHRGGSVCKEKSGEREERDREVERRRVPDWGYYHPGVYCESSHPAVPYNRRSRRRLH